MFHLVFKAGLEHLHLIKKIGEDTFRETFSEMNTEDDMKKYLSENFSTEKLSEEISNNNSEYYYAMEQGDIMGYLKLNFKDAQTELKDSKSLEIERIYVLKEFQEEGVGLSFLNKAKQRAKQCNLDFIWLGVWEENSKAIHFYKKHGFEKFDKHTFVLGNDKQTDIMMKLKLK